MRSCSGTDSGQWTTRNFPACSAELHQSDAWEWVAIFSFYFLRGQTGITNHLISQNCFLPWWALQGNQQSEVNTQKWAVPPWWAIKRAANSTLDGWQIKLPQIFLRWSISDICVLDFFFLTIWLKSEMHVNYWALESFKKSTVLYKNKTLLTDALIGSDSLHPGQTPTFVSLARGQQTKTE